MIRYDISRVADTCLAGESSSELVQGQHLVSACSDFIQSARLGNRARRLCFTSDVVQHLTRQFCCWWRRANLLMNSNKGVHNERVVHCPTALDQNLNCFVVG